MNTAAIDMSTFKPLPGANQSPLDMSTFKPLNGGGGAPPTAGAAPAAPAKPQPVLTDNPNGEGLYNMSGPDGTSAQIPFSKVPVAAQSAYNFADGNEHARYTKDRMASPIGSGPEGVKFLLQDLNNKPGFVGETMGGVRGVAKTVDGLRQILGMGSKNPDDPLNELANTKPGKDAGSAAKISNAAGEIQENLGEFFSGEELMSLLGKGIQALPLAERLKNATQLAQVMKAHPMVGALTRIGLTALKQAGVGGAQTYLKTGGDAGAAGEAAATTGVLGAVVGGAGEGLSSAIAKRAPTVESVGGVPTTVTAEMRNARPTAQQAAGQKSITNAAKGALEPHLAEVNESRAVPANKPALPASTGPYEFNLRGVTPEQGTTGEIGQSAAKRPQAAFRPPQYTTASAPTRTGTRPPQFAPDENGRMQMVDSGGPSANEGSMGADIRSHGVPEPQADVASGGGVLKTQDPNIARAHAQNLNDVVESPSFKDMPAKQQSDILAARDDAQRQLSEYHEQVAQKLPGYGRPNFAPIDIPSTVKKVGSWSDTAGALKKTAMDGYKQITDALAFTGHSPQNLEMVRNAYQSAEDKFMGAETPEALRSAEGEVEAAHEQLRTMMKDIPNAVSLKEFSGMNDAYRNALGLQKVAKAVDGSFQGSMSTAKRAFEYAGFDGNKLQRNMDNLIRTMGRNRVERLMGRDNLDTVLQVAQLNRTGAARGRVGMAIKAVVQPLMSMHVGPIAAGAYVGHMAGVPYEVGGAAGAGVAWATRKVMDAVLTNPKVAQNLIFAIHSGASPEKYGPMLATMIQQQETEASRQRQAQPSPGGDNQ